MSSMTVSLNSLHQMIKSDFVSHPLITILETNHCALCRPADRGRLEVQDVEFPTGQADANLILGRGPILGRPLSAHFAARNAVF